jgi:hypothetical protein
MGDLIYGKSLSHLSPSMNSKARYIGLNQRIPFEVLDAAIHSYLETGSIDRSYFLQSMQEFTSGINRANKAVSYVVQIITRQHHILEVFKKSTNAKDYIALRIEDRKALCLCLISLTYPIAYDLLVALAQGFKVQSQINKKFISEKVMSIYGSNRTVDIALDALLPMIIELNTIQRAKVSIYELASKLKIRNKFVSELIVYTDIKLSGSKSILIDDLGHRPWYSYFELPAFQVNKTYHLLSKKDGVLGKGYLTI